MFVLCTERAGELDLLAGLPDDRRIGVGVINQKDQRVASLDEVVARGRRPIDLLGAERVLLNPDCGFAHFADNPIVTAGSAEASLAVLAPARDRIRDGREAEATGSGTGAPAVEVRLPGAALP